MAGGTFVTTNKVRPGAYINFIAKPQPLLNLSDRGVVALALPLSWGPQDTIIDLFSTDLTDGTSLAKIGYSAGDTESLPFRLALTNCYHGKVYRLDIGGAKATAASGTGGTGYTINAKYNGIVGNNIQVVVTKQTVNAVDSYTVETLFRTLSVDKQAGLKKPTDFVSNDYVDFVATGTSVFVELTAVTLAGGTNGTVTESTAYPLFFGKMKNQLWNTMGITSVDPLTKASLDLYIKNLRNLEGIKVQGVVSDYVSSDDEAIISPKQGYKTSAETITPALFALWVAGATAGAEINESNTKKVIQDAIEITGELSNTEIIDALNQGYFIISKRRDGVISVEKDINTLHTFTAKKSYDFSKNRVIRVLDEMGNTINLTWEKSYCGKLDNDANGRSIFLADLINYGNNLQDVHAITNFLGSKDISIEQGPKPDDVVVAWPVQAVDSMEKLYATFAVGSKA